MFQILRALLGPAIRLGSGEKEVHSDFYMGKVNFVFHLNGGHWINIRRLFDTINWNFNGPWKAHLCRNTRNRISVTNLNHHNCDGIIVCQLFGRDVT